MGDRFSAVVRALRTFGQGLVAAVLVAGGEALHTALTSGATFDPRFIVMSVVAAVVGAAVSYAYNVIAPKAGVEGPATLEGLARAFRTLVQMVVAVGLTAAWDSVYVSVTGGNYNPRDIAMAALAAVVTAVTAFVHNSAGAKKVRS
jgi:hypothetical protein